MTAPVGFGFRADIQGLRGLAVLVVVGFHSGLGPTGGYLGVDMFFVVSGFVITLVLRKEHLASGRVAMGTFYARRIRRLLPAFALFSLTTTILAAYLVRGAVVRSAIAETAGAASLFFANVQLESNGGGYFSPASELNPFLHTWSLSVEEQFYFVFPLTLAVAWWVGRKLRHGETWGQVVMALVTAVSAAAAIVIVLDGDLRQAFYSTPLRAWEFGLGVLLALNLRHLERLGTRTAIALCGTGLVAVLGSAVLYSESTTWPGLTAVVPTLGTALLIAGGTVVNPVSRLVSWGPLVWIGDRSYGWYLWHWPGVVFAELRWPDASWAVPVLAFGSLAVAALSYVLVEQPIRHSPRVTGLAVLVVLSIGVTVPFGAATVMGRDADLVLAPVEGGYGNFTRTWDLEACVNLPWDREQCTFPADGAVGTVLVVGDSMSTAMTDVITDAAARVQLTTVVHTMFGCPVFEIPVEEGGRDGGDSCTRYQENVLDVIDELRPEIVFVTHRSPEWVRPDDVRPLTFDDGEVIPTQEEATAVWAEAAREFFERVEPPVLLMTTVPEFPEEVTQHIAAGRVDHPELVQTLEQVEERRGAVVAVEEAAARADGNVLVFDPVPVLCPHDICSVRGEDRWLYHDSHHMRAYATEVFADPLTEAFRTMLRGLATGQNR